MNTKFLKIGELANALNVSTDTLRFYEKNRLLTPAARSESGYRLYSQHERQRLGFIISAKAVGFTLEEIKKLLTLEITKDKVSCAEVKSYIDNKAAQLDRHILEMQTMQQHLKKLSDACSGSKQPAVHCNILQILNEVNNEAEPATLEQNQENQSHA